MLVFPKEKHQNSQKRAKFMNFSFWPFLWSGLPGRLLGEGHCILDEAEWKVVLDSLGEAAGMWEQLLPMWAMLEVEEGSALALRLSMKVLRPWFLLSGLTSTREKVRRNPTLRAQRLKSFKIALRD